MTNILHLDASVRNEGSVSRAGSAALVERLTAGNPGATVTYRDLAGGEPPLDAAWVGATFTPPADRSPEQKAALAHSDALLGELQAADTIVIGLPLYNFGLPSGLKTWIDQISRAGVTFRYTENGPEGLVGGKRVLVAFASGGTPIGAPYDFATPYLRHALGFIGITDVEVIPAREAAQGDLPLAA